MFRKLFRYWSAIEVLLDGIEAAKDDGKITASEVLEIFGNALHAAGLEDIVIYEDAPHEEAMAVFNGRKAKTAKGMAYLKDK